MDISLNYTVLILAGIVGCILGGGIYWYSRKAGLACAVPIGILLLTAFVLPWNATDEVDPQQTDWPTMVSLKSTFPAEVPQTGFVGSDACRECHSDNHQSWHASYHRSMTQVATPDALVRDLDSVKVSLQGSDYRFKQREDVYWVEINEQAASAGTPNLNVPLVMTTGSHHMQAYWFATGLGRMTGLLPIIHLNETQEFVPRSHAFLRPEVFHPEDETGRWNAECSSCHATNRRERPRGQQGWDTQASELGISCEACHGPGEQHIDFQLKHSSRASDTDQNADAVDPIVNPVDLTHERSSQVCGQCHSIKMRTEDLQKLNEHGHGYRAGDDLSKTHLVWQRDIAKIREFNKRENLPGAKDDMLPRSFYPDGVTRVPGREYSALIASACHVRGKMSCLSCHQMHKSESDSRSLSEWANDQLKPEAMGDQACLQCHQADQYGQSHTHHKPNSSGASCYNCHMPHTAYGLLKGVRNHTITSPNIAKDLKAKRPNACNLCHLDKTLQWSADNAQKWYGIDPPELSNEQKSIAASLLWMLKGDAAERALVSWSMSWPPAKAVSGETWQPPFLAHGLDDDYPAVRLIARNTLRTYDGLQTLNSTSTTPAPKRIELVQRISEAWQRQSSLKANPQLLIDDEGKVIQRTVQRLIQQQDKTTIDLAE